MSAQSGITASPELLDSFRNLKDEVLIVRLSSDSTHLIPETTLPVKGTIEGVFRDLHAYLEKDFPLPAFAIVPEESSSNASNAFISFIPDVAPIRSKMLYASTKNTLLIELGSSNFKKTHILSWSELEELTYESFQKAVAVHDGPLSKEEELLKEVNSLQTLSLAESSGNGRNSFFKKELPSMHNSPSPAPLLGGNKGLLLKIEPQLEAEFESLAELKLIRFVVDLASELLRLISTTSDLKLEKLIEALEKPAGLLPQPNFALFGYNGKSVALIYSCPSGSKVKDRMLSAANVQGLLSHLRSLAGENATIDKVIEIGDLDELHLSDLQGSETSTEPSTSNGSLKFAKPKGPRRR